MRPTREICRQMVVEDLRRGPMTANEVAQATDLSYHTVYPVLAALVRSGRAGRAKGAFGDVLWWMREEV